MVEPPSAAQQSGQEEEDGVVEGDKVGWKSTHQIWPRDDIILCE